MKDKRFCKFGFYSLSAVSLLLIQSCAYSLQGTQNRLSDEEGVRTVYLAPVQNGTYKAGIENVVFNAMAKTIASNRRLKIVNNEASADAVLSASVTRAEFESSGQTSAEKLEPYLNKELNTYAVSSEYTATLDCVFALRKTKTLKELWGSNFTRAMKFPANNQLGPYGTTSSLINESEFDRALSVMADSMMDDVHEFMLAQF
jgi:hypothetical protein